MGQARTPVDVKGAIGGQQDHNQLLFPRTNWKRAVTAPLGQYSEMHSNEGGANTEHGVL